MTKLIHYLCPFLSFYRFGAVIKTQRGLQNDDFINDTFTVYEELLTKVSLWTT